MNADGTNPRALTRENDHEVPVADVHARRQVRRRVEGQRSLHVLRERRRRRASASRATPRRAAARRRRAAVAAATAPNVFLGPAVEQGRPLHLHRDAQQHRRRLQPDRRSAGRSACSIARRAASFTQDERRRQRHAPRAEPRRQVARVRDAQRRRRRRSCCATSATGDERMLVAEVQRDDQESRPNRDRLADVRVHAGQQVDRHRASRPLLARRRRRRARRR